MIKPLAKAVRCNIVDFPCCASENSLLSVLGNRPLSYAAATKFPSIEAMARLRSCEIPCFFPVKQGIFARDGFAQDWPLRHLARISAAFFRLAVAYTESGTQEAANWDGCAWSCIAADHRLPRSFHLTAVSRAPSRVLLAAALRGRGMVLVKFSRLRQPDAFQSSSFDLVAEALNDQADQRQTERGVGEINAVKFLGRYAAQYTFP